MDWLAENNRRRSYDAMNDRYLRDYFTLPQVKNQLCRVGLMTQDGRMLTDEEYKRAAIRRHQRWAARQQLAHRMAMDARDSHLGKQLELQRQLQAVSRVEHYRKSRGDSNKQNLVSIAPLEVERSLTRSQSAPSYRVQSNRSGTSIPPLISPEHQFNSSGYHTDDDRPRSELPDQEERARQKRALRRRYLKELDRYTFLHKLDNDSLESYDAYLRLQLGRLERARFRPFTYTYADDDEITHLLTSVEPDAGLPEIPDRPIDSLYDYRGRANSTRPRWRHLEVRRKTGSVDVANGDDGGDSRRGQRSRSQSPKKDWQKNKAPLSRLYVTSAAAPGRRRRQPQASCECFLQYSGPPRIVGEKPAEKRLHSISITQQHCGGNTINVFTGELMPKAKFQFVSFRQRGYPFSLTFLEDGNTVLRVSTCCESRYPVGTRLGGKKGQFRWLGAQNAVPCYKCQMYRGLEAPYTNLTNEPIIKKKKSSTVANAQLSGSLSAKPPRPRPPAPSQPKKSSPVKKKASTSSTGKNVAIGTTAVVVGAAAVAAGAGAALAMANGHNEEENQEENASGKSGDEAEAEAEAEAKQESPTIQHDSEEHSDGGEEAETGSGSGSESGESESESGSESEGDHEEVDMADHEEHTSRNVSRSSAGSQEATATDEQTESATAAGTAAEIHQEESGEEETDHDHSEHHQDEERSVTHQDESHHSHENGTASESEETATKTGENEDEHENEQPSEATKDGNEDKSNHDATETNSKHSAVEESGSGSGSGSGSESGSGSGSESESGSETDGEEAKPEISKAESFHEQMIPEAQVQENGEQKMENGDVSTSVGPEKQEHEEESSGSGSGSESDEESEGADNHSKSNNSQSTVKAAHDDHESKSESASASAIAKGDNEGAQEKEADSHKADGEMESLSKASAGASTSQLHQDAGIQPGRPTDDSEIGSSSDSESSSSDSEEATDQQKSLADQNGDENLTEKLKSASTALLAAEAQLSQEQESNENPDQELADQPILENRVSRGDLWYCKICNFDNEPDTSKCRICGVARDTNDGHTGRAPSISPDPHHDQERSDTELLGPWTCRICNFDNGIDLHRCRVCGVPRSTSESVPTGDPESVPGPGPLVNVDQARVPVPVVDEARMVEEVGKDLAKDDDEDTLADAESIKNEMSDHHLDEYGEFLRPSINVVPPSTSPSAMSSDEARGHVESHVVHEEALVESGTDHPPEPPETEPSHSNQPDDHLSHHSHTDLDADDASQHHYGEYPDTSNAEENTTIQNTLASADIHASADQEVIIREKSAPMVIAVSEDDHHEDGDEDGGKRDAVSAKLKELCSKEDVAINNIELDDAAMKIITAELRQNQNIRSLSIRSAHLTDDGLASIDGALLASGTPPIKALNFNMNYLSSASVPRLVDMVRRLQIESLLLRGNAIGDEAMANLFHELEPLNTVQKLDVGENNLNKKSARALSKLIATTTSMQALSLGGNPDFDQDDWQFIAKGLMNNETLETINLDYCHMGDDALETVSMALKSNQNLKSIDLDGNDISDRGAAAVLDMVDQLPNLNTIVWMAGNQVSQNASAVVRQVLSTRK